MPSWKKVLQSGSAVHILNITASNIPDMHKPFVLMYNTASGAITYVTHSIPDLSTTTNVFQGTIRYFNNAQTPMTNTTLRLLDSNGGQVTSVITNASGDFNFGYGRLFGNYYIKVEHNKPWGGVTATDALNITRHFSATQLLTGINLKAADVNKTDTISATDALQVSQRVAFLRNSFDAGDWVYSITGSGVPPETYWYGNEPLGLPYTASQQNINDIVIYTLSVGDVNGSYTPNVNL